MLDLLVVGAGPTGIAIGAAARQAGLNILLVDRGPLVAAIQQYPVFMEFFTTRDRLEIADVPFTIAEDKPTRRQALVYYRSVVERYQIPVALFEEVTDVKKEGDIFTVVTAKRTLRARAVAIATGYFGNPRRLGVPGEDLPWVHSRYQEAYLHYGQQVVVIGAGNTAAEAALDMWRNGVKVSMIHRGSHVRPGVKYWLKPDIENRIEEGSIPMRFNTVVRAFRDGEGVEVEGPNGREIVPAQAAYVLLGYTPDADFERRVGIELDPESLIPVYNPETCESNVPGLYVAGTLQAGRATDKIFIENSRDNGPKIVQHLVGRLDSQRGKK
jgi:thioredoxin reductase (NADPH)